VTWSHNTHYADRVLHLLPPSGKAILEIGPGDGYFSEMLADRFGQVVAMDPDPAQVEAARRRCAERENVSVLHGDFLTADLPTGGFDAVTALAAFHHMPLEPAFRRASDVLKPGGRLVILGVWTDRGRRDFLRNLQSVRMNRRLQRQLGPDSMTAPSTLERTSWHETRAWCRLSAPEARLRRLPLWRYTLVWDKPYS
jgi:SAM-dependent methyltransferase